MDVNGEKVVVVNDHTVIQVKATKNSKISRCLYIKENDTSEELPSSYGGKTLIVLNVPPYVTEDGLSEMFSECGVVKRVFLKPKPTSNFAKEEIVDKNDLFAPPAPLYRGCQVAYVVFEKKSSIQRALKMPYSAADRCLGAEKSITGLQKYRNAYIAQGPPRPDVLRSQIDEYMKEFDERVEKEKQVAKETEGVPDEEGWVTITKSKGLPNTDAHNERVKHKLQKRNKEKELLHFYKFQVRDSKKEHLTTLRKKFEEDKLRIAQMKAARKFRPY